MTKSPGDSNRRRGGGKVSGVLVGDRIARHGFLGGYGSALKGGNAAGTAFDTSLSGYILILRKILEKNRNPRLRSKPIGL